MGTRNQHGWTHRTEEGRKREVCARLFGRRWTFEAKHADEDDWAPLDPTLEDLLELRRVLFQKYQRKHLAWEHLRSVEELILARGGSWEED